MRKTYQEEAFNLDGDDGQNAPESDDDDDYDDHDDNGSDEEEEVEAITQKGRASQVKNGIFPKIIKYTNKN